MSPERDGQKGIAADLRTALAELRSYQELAEVTGEVNWDRELGAVTREVLRRKGPALLFRNIRGYSSDSAPCRQLATSLLASRRRIALLLGLDEDADNKALIRYVQGKNNERLAPVLMDDGAVHEVVNTQDIDLFQLPVPKWHYLDGGRYINTFSAIVTRDPDDRTMNVGVYRGMIGSRDSIPSLVVGSQHWGLHWRKYRDAGRAMPVACVVGWHPVMDFLAGSPIPAGVCEYDVMGAYLGEPVPLVRCVSQDLLVPATAELVIEGYISPDSSDYELEGPFGEFTGYVSDLPTRRPTIRATAVTHRADPIFRGTLEGSLPGASGENSHMSSIQRAAIAWNTLESARVPGILDVYVHPVTNGTNIIVQIQKRSEGHAKWVASALWATGAALYRYKNVVVVDDDIDPSDYSAIDWAIAYRVRAGTNDVVMFPGHFGSPIDPSTPIEERALDQLGTGLWNRVLIDATRTWRHERRPEWGGRSFPPTVEPAPEDVRLVKERWQDYGFTGWDKAY